MEPGKGKVIVHRLALDLKLPAMTGRKAVLRDFSLQKIGEVDASTGLNIAENQPVFDVLLIGPGEKAE